MQNNLVVSALVENANEIMRKFSKLVKSSGCNIVNSHFKVLGQELSLTLFLAGSWDAIAKIEDMLRTFAQAHSIKILMRRTTVDERQGDSMPYAVDVVGLDQSGTIFVVSNFMLENGLSIQEMSSNTYTTAMTGAKMFALHIMVNIPVDSSIARIRGDFIEFCDRLNLDAIMEPVK